MNKYKVFFQFKGKKMVIETEARDKYAAENNIIDLLEIHEVRLIEGQEPELNTNMYNNKENLDMLKGMFGFK